MNAAAFLLTGWILTGCVPIDAGGGGQAEDVTEVAIRSLAFVPEAVTVQQGERVRWTNEEFGLVRHTVTSGDPGDADAGAVFDSGGLSPGETFTHTFNEIGTFVYFCTIHAGDPDMRDATVTVVAAGSQP